MTFFNDTELSIYTKQLEAAGPEATDILLEMFFYTLRQNKMDLSAMMQNSTQYSFVCRSMVVLLKDKRDYTISCKHQFQQSSF